MDNPWKWGEKFQQIPSPTQMNLQKRGNGVALFCRNLIPTQMKVCKRGFLAFLVRFFKEGFPSNPINHMLIPLCDPIVMSLAIM